MKLDITAKANLSDVPSVIVEQAKEESKPVVSMESLVKNDIPQNCGDAPGGPKMMRYNTLPFVREETSEGVNWRIYLNILEFKDTIVNLFIATMRQVEPNDKVFIHAPSFVDDHFAIGIWSAITLCKGNVTIAAPYCLNTAAAFIATAAKKLVVSDVMYWNITAPIVFGIGAHLDVKSGSNAQVDIYVRMYRALMSRGYLTQAEYEGLVYHQHNVALFGEELAHRTGEHFAR